jgi:hypothetical protein
MKVVSDSDDDNLLLLWNKGYNEEQLARVLVFIYANLSKQSTSE